MKILEATYGSGDCVLDVTERLRGLVKNDRLLLTVSNRLFTDPCVNQIKTLRFTYQLPGEVEPHFHEVEEHRILLVPTVDTKNVGIFYTNNSIPSKYLNRVLGQLEKSSHSVDIITCSWRPIEGNPFPELNWSYHVSHYLTLTLQILQLLYTAQELGRYEYVFFLEHDVLYPEGYFDIDPFSEDVLWNTNYIGLCEQGFQTNSPDHFSLHLLTMRLSSAIDHFMSCIRGLLMGTFVMIEPLVQSRTTRRSTEPVVHINHGNHFTPYFTTFSKRKHREDPPILGPGCHLVGVVHW